MGLEKEQSGKMEGRPRECLALLLVFQIFYGKRGNCIGLQVSEQLALGFPVHWRQTVHSLLCRRKEYCLCVLEVSPVTVVPIVYK